MKRLSRLFTAAVIALTPFAVGGTAFAAGTCQIGYTGPDSNNNCTLTSTYTCTVKNKTDFDIVNDSNQRVASGTASSTGNTSGGGATSGSASNSNGTNFNVSIDNSNDTCTVVKTVPATTTPTTPTTPSKTTTEETTPVGGMGSFNPPAVTKQTVQAPQQSAAAPTVLPNTSGDEMATTLVTVTGLLAAAAAASRLAVATYGRFKS